jgi:hypothetical protein
LDLGEKDSGGGGLGFCREREGGEKVCIILSSIELIVN